VRNLIADGTPAVVYDLDADPRRLRLLLTPDELGRVTFVKGDITDLDDFGSALDAHEITHIIHFAGLQVPFCKANPSLGAQVNVVGTVNVFEAVKQRKDRIGGVVYASSVAVFGAPGDYGQGAVMRDDTPLNPHTHYGVFKQANEGTARIYWDDDGVPSIGFRPYVVYGIGRDQGVTSTPTTAMLAAAAGLDYHISFGGQTTFHLADDTAKAFIQAARTPFDGAGVHNLGGPAPHMQQVVDAIRAAEPSSVGITFEPSALPFLAEVDSSGLEDRIGQVHHRSLEEGVADTISGFRRLIADGQIDPQTYVNDRR